MAKKTTPTADDLFADLNTEIAPPEITRAVTEFDTSGNVTSTYGDLDEFNAIFNDDEDEVEIEVDQDESESEDEEVEKPKEVKPDDEDEDGDDEDEDTYKAVETKKEISRSQKRVLESRNEVKAEKLKRIEAETELKKANLERAKAYKIANEMAVDNQKTVVESLKTQLKSALDDGDNDKVIDIQSKLARSSSLLEQYEANLPNMDTAVKSLEEKVKEPTSSVDNGLPEAAQTWLQGKEFIVENSEYVKLKGDKRKQAARLRQRLPLLSRELMDEGFTTDTPDFYEELDVRLSNEFDFYDGIVALTEEDDVDLVIPSGETSKKPQDKKDTSPKKSVSEKRKSVPAKGPSVAAPSGPSSRTQKVRMSTAEFNDHKKTWETYLSEKETFKTYMQRVVKSK